MEFRKVEKFVNRKWIECKFEELKDGDIFRMFEATGEAVIGSYNETEFIASGDAYLNKDGIWAIDILL